jgi:hypothetical protein
MVGFRYEVLRQNPAFISQFSPDVCGKVCVNLFHTQKSTQVFGKYLLRKRKEISSFVKRTPQKSSVNPRAPRNIAFNTTAHMQLLFKEKKATSSGLVFYFFSLT